MGRHTKRYLHVPGRAHAWRWPHTHRVPQRCCSAVRRVKNKVQNGKMKVRLSLTVSHIVLWKPFKGNIYILLPLTRWEEWPLQIPITSFPLHLNSAYEIYFPLHWSLVCDCAKAPWSHGQRKNDGCCVLLHQCELPSFRLAKLSPSSSGLWPLRREGQSRRGMGTKWGPFQEHGLFLLYCQYTKKQGWKSLNHSEKSRSSWLGEATIQ